MVRFGGVHTFGYNSVERELILMKFGALWVHCQGLALADFGHDPHSSESWRARRKFYWFLSGKQRTISPISHWPHLTKFEQSTSWGDENFQNNFEFENFTVRGRFPKKMQKKFFKHFKRLATSCIYNSAWKFTAKWSLHVMSSFHFLAWLPPSRPNKVGLKCQSVHTFLRPQKISLISMKCGL